MTQQTAPSPTERYVSSFGDLMREVRDAGLMERRQHWYWVHIVGWTSAFAGLWVAFFALGASWWQLVVAALLGVVSTQFGFLGHDAAHRQIFASRAWNDWTARLVAGLGAGLSVAWWRAKHNRHHRAPNTEGVDPDIGPGAIAFTPAIVAERTGFAGWFARNQGWLFFPLLTLEGLNLHVASFREAVGAVRSSDGRRSWPRLELALLVVRLGGYLAVVFACLPFAMALAFIAVQLAVFGVCLGASFAPSHKGMPIIPATMELDFLRRQVMTSRNVRGNAAIDLAMGGLNHQIEHHLFPSMPRPHLRLAKPYVRAHCERLGIEYHEVGLWRSYAIVVDYLNHVGLRARDPFDCPLAAQLRG